MTDWDSLSRAKQVALLREVAEEVLSETQWRRFHLHHFEGFDVKWLAAAERVSETAIRKSLSGSLLLVRAARDERLKREAAA